MEVSKAVSSIAGQKKAAFNVLKSTGIPMAILREDSGLVSFAENP